MGAHVITSRLLVPGHSRRPYKSNLAGFSVDRCRGAKGFASISSHFSRPAPLFAPRHAAARPELLTHSSLVRMSLAGWSGFSAGLTRRLMTSQRLSHRASADGFTAVCKDLGCRGRTPPCFARNSR